VVPSDERYLGEVVECTGDADPVAPTPRHREPFLEHRHRPVVVALDEQCRSKQGVHYRHLHLLAGTAEEWKSLLKTGRGPLEVPAAHRAHSLHAPGVCGAERVLGSSG
jgi:hypothetical protein